MLGMKRKEPTKVVINSVEEYSMDSAEYLFTLPENPLPKKLQNFRLQKQFIDLQISVGNQSFDCHKLVLQNFSPVIDRQLQEQLSWNYPSVSPSCSRRGASGNPNHNLTLKVELDEQYIEPEIVEELLNYLYLGQFKFTVHNAKYACLASYHLQIAPLLSASEEYLCHHIDDNNLVEYYVLALRCELGILLKGCLTYLAEHHTLLYKKREFRDFECEELVTLFSQLDGISPGNLDLKESVFYCINQWIQEDLRIRKFFMESLLNAIPLDELRFRFLADHVAEHTVVRKSDPCSQLLIDALVKTSKRDSEMVAKHFAPGSPGNPRYSGSYSSETMVKSSSKSSILTRFKSKTLPPPKPSRQVSFSQAQNTKHSQNLYVFSGGSGKGSGPKFSLSNLTSGSEKWTTTKKFSTKRDILGVTAVDKRIFIAGRPLEDDPKSIQNLWGVLAKNQRDNLNDVLCGMMPFEEYDLETGEWKIHEYLPYFRDNFGMCSWNGQIYIAGGRDAHGFELSTVIRYDPNRMEWKSLPEMNRKRSNVRLVELEGCLYAIGGEGLDSIEKYDHSVGKWTMMGGMNFQWSSRFTAVSHNRKLYVLGVEGFEVYSPTSENWFALPPCPVDVCDGSQLVSFNDQLLAIGGKNPGSLSPTSAIYQFDTLTRKWSKLSDMSSTSIHGKSHFSVVINDY